MALDLSGLDAIPEAAPATLDLSGLDAIPEAPAAAAPVALDLSGLEAIPEGKPAAPPKREPMGMIETISRAAESALTSRRRPSEADIARQQEPPGAAATSLIDPYPQSPERKAFLEGPSRKLDTTTIIGEGVKGLAAGGVGTNPKLLGGALSGAGALLDSPTLEMEGDKIAAYGIAELKKLKPKVGSIEQVGSVGDFGKFLAQGAGQAVGTSAPGILTGAITAAASRNPLAGFAVAYFGNSYWQNFGDVFTSAREDKDIQERLRTGDLTRKEMAQVSLAAAVPIAALDTLSMGTVMGQAFKPAKAELMRRLIKVMTTTGGAEGSTEATQAVLSQWAREYLGAQIPFADKLIEVVNEFFAGAGGGALIGGAAHVAANAAGKPDRAAAMAGELQASVEATEVPQDAARRQAVASLSPDRAQLRAVVAQPEVVAVDAEQAPAAQTVQPAGTTGEFSASLPAGTARPAPIEGAAVPEGREAPEAPVEAPEPESDALEAFPSSMAAVVEAKRVSKLTGEAQKVIPHPTEEGRWAIEAVPAKPKSDKQLAAAEKMRARMKARQQVDLNDPITTAVAKLGGIRLDQSMDVTGEGKPMRAPFARMRMLVRRNGGEGLDGMREKLTELGYLPEGADINDMIARIQDELGGAKQFSTYADERVAFGEPEEPGPAEQLQNDAADFADEIGAEEFEAQVPQEELDKLVEFVPANEAEMNGEQSVIAELLDRLNALDESKAERIALQSDGKSNAEIARELQDAISEAGEPGVDVRRAPVGEGESFTLKTQTPEELAKLDADARARADRERTEEQAAADRDRADRERAEFVLTGSDRPADTGAASGQMGLDLRQHPAWHGSPRDFDEFSLHKIGTGEGAASYGWGLYFADKKGVAEHYKKGLSHKALIEKARDAYDEFDSPDGALENLLASDDLNAGEKTFMKALADEDWFGYDYPHQAVSAAFMSPRKRGFDHSPEMEKAIAGMGRLYQVNLAPAEDEYLDWDKPLSEQSEKVRAALENAPVEIKAIKMGGADIYDALADYFSDGQPGSGERNPEAASRYLASIGISGIRYLDQGSRNASTKIEHDPWSDGWRVKQADGTWKTFPTRKAAVASVETYNYVIFDDRLIKIVEKSARQMNFDPDPTEAQEVERGLAEKTAEGAADWLAKNSPQPGQKIVAERAAQQIRRLAQAGVVFDFRIAHVGEEVPAALLSSRGITAHATQLGVIKVFLNGADVTGKVGTSYEVALHEIVHAATMGAIKFGNQKGNANTPIGRDVKALYDVTNHVIRRFNERVAARSRNPDLAISEPLTDFEARTFRGENNALANPDEVVAWTLTNREMQEYLDTIPYDSKQSAWGKFVSAVRKLIGLPANMDTALSEVLRVSDRLLSADVVIAAGPGATNGGRGQLEMDLSPARQAVDIAMAVQQNQLPTPAQRAQYVTRAGQRIRIRQPTTPPHLWTNDIGSFVDHVVKPRTIAVFNRAAVPAWEAMRGEEKFRDEKFAEYYRLAEPYFLASRADKKVINSILEHDRLTGSIGLAGQNMAVQFTSAKAQLSKPGQSVTVTPEQKSAYWAARRYLERSFNDFREQIIADLGLPPGTTPAMLRAQAAMPRPQNATTTQVAQWRIMQKRGAKMADQLQEIEDSYKKGYFPFTRFGNVGITVRDQAGNLVEFKTLEVGWGRRKLARGDMRKVKEAREEQGFLRATYPGYTVSEPFQLSEFELPKEVKLSEVDALAEIARIPDAEWKPMLEAMRMGQAAQGFRAHMFRSKDTPGYSTDFERVLASHINQSATFNARRKFAKAWEEAIEGIDPGKQKVLRQYWKDLADDVHTPTEEFSFLRQVSFVYYLTSIASWATNLTQTLTTGLPTMLQFVDVGAALGYLARGHAEAASMLSWKETKKLFFYDMQKAPADIRAELQKAWDEGQFINVVTKEYMGLAKNQHPLVRAMTPAGRAATQILGAGFTAAEMQNRISFYIANLRAARDLPTVKTRFAAQMGEHALAERLIANWSPEAYAEFMNDETNFVMGKSNRARLERGLGALATQFWGYTWNLFERMFTMASIQGAPGKAAVALMLGILWFVVGIWGLPGIDRVRKLIEWAHRHIFKSDLDVDLEMRRILTEVETTGTLARMNSGGITRATGGPELASRLGQGQVFGIPVIADLAMRIPDAMRQMELGNTYLALAELVPKQAGDILIQQHWGRYGIQTQEGKPILTPEQITARMRWLKGIGFSDAEVAEVRAREFAEQRILHSVDDKTRDLHKRLARAKIEKERAEATGDQARAAEAELDAEKVLTERDRWNATHKRYEQIRLDPAVRREYLARERQGADRQKGQKKKARGEIREIQRLFGTP